MIDNFQLSSARGDYHSDWCQLWWFDLTPPYLLECSSGRSQLFCLGVGRLNSMEKVLK